MEHPRTVNVVRSISSHLGSPLVLSRACGAGHKRKLVAGHVTCGCSGARGRRGGSFRAGAGRRGPCPGSGFGCGTGGRGGGAGRALGRRTSRARKDSTIEERIRRPRWVNQIMSVYNIRSNPLTEGGGIGTAKPREGASVGPVHQTNIDHQRITLTHAERQSTDK